MHSATLKTLLVLALLLPRSPAGAQTRRTADASELAALLDSIAAAELRLFWFESGAGAFRSQYRIPVRLGPDLPALIDPCSRVSPLPSRSRVARLPLARGYPPGAGRLLESPSGGALCATWDRTQGRFTFADMWRHGPAPALLRPVPREPIQRLLALLDSAARLSPSDSWIAGQRVRFLLLADERHRARGAVRECAAAPVWCHALSGLVFAANGMIHEADSVFALAGAAMPPGPRCEWDDIRVLLDSLDRVEYERLSCAEREAIASRYWWLSDPLLSVPGNERRVEQHLRQVGLAIQSALPRDERVDWRPRAGGDAAAEMITRYGMPVSVNLSSLSDRANLWFERGSFGYSPLRLRVGVAWSAVAGRLLPARDDWNLTPVDESAADSEWPPEHFVPPYAIAQIASEQVAFLRRDTSVIVLAATETPSELLGRPMGSAVTGTLVVTPRPNVIHVVTAVSGVVGQTLRLRGSIASKAGVLGIEISPGPGGEPAARTRFGFDPPATLTKLVELGAGELAVSTPVLLDASVVEGDSLSDPVRALDRMSGTTDVGGTRRVSVYWETYGASPDDTVNLAVWIERRTPQGFVRRLGIALNVTPDLNTPVAASWTEAGLSQRAREIPGVVPIVARTVDLDLTALPPGEYLLSLAAARPGREPVRNGVRVIVP